MKVQFKHILNRFDFLESRELNLQDSLYLLEGERAYTNREFTPSTEGGNIVYDELKKIRQLKKDILKMYCDLETQEIATIFS